MFDEKNQRAKISSDFVPLGKGGRCIKPSKQPANVQNCA
jgi:hypothetical protein